MVFSGVSWAGGGIGHGYMRCFRLRWYGAHGLPAGFKPTGRGDDHQETYNPVTMRAQSLAGYRIRFPLRRLAGEDLRVRWKTFGRATSVHKTLCTQYFYLRSLCREREVVLDHRHRHDVEDAAGIGVLRIGQFVVAATLVVGVLNLAIHLAAIRAFEIDAVVAMGVNRAANDRVGDLLLGDLLDVERFLVADVELGSDLVDHVLHGDLPRRRPCALLALARFELHRAAAARPHPDTRRRPS